MGNAEQGPHQAGVGAVLAISGTSPGVKRMFDHMSTRVAAPMNRDELHLTLVDSTETSIPVFSVRDEIALRNTQDQLTAYLGRMPLYEIMLAPSAREFQKLGRAAVIPVEDSPWIEEMRAVADEIVTQNLGVHLGSRDWKPHISVARLMHGRSRIDAHMAPVPKNFAIDGYFVGQRLMGEYRRFKRQSYVNNANRRHRS